MEIRDPALFLDYLASVHKRTRRVIDLIPPNDIEWSPVPGKFSFGDLVRHLAGIERYMYAETVNGRPSRYPGHGTEVADGLSEVVEYYEQLHGESVALFSLLTPEAMLEKSVTPAGSPITTYKWLRLMVEHEAHHRGQIYLMLGMRGVVTPPIYGLTAEEVQAKSIGSSG